ncbi:tRNA 2-thiouridine(34) synthase MnmA [Peptostreptococcus equinus]|uniref:tRNA-specific 2-thiouridylase MnmA n=1 Tax=Peptostreptococcus equinus TaxID=3003601 RepID=A0ABY7JLU4_9FIRM|nr:tRNA 2-thiouridine(34) synthase MnmA [Peptostreptococcus sp. CBA3647]WAW14045.1 tRNA 2-thiouridine(34) synthase MnmA [Peptostreptococcus sp. CBA3647]
MKIENNRVLLGMSGGVDSSVAAYLLKKQGYDVVGVHMKLWDSGDNKHINDAKKVCDSLGIEFHVVDLQNEFKNKVIKNFVREYEMGRTPNPCVFCNKNIKFGDLFKKADELNCKYISTGHYALCLKNEETGRYEIHRADNDHKDQTYVLYNLTQDKLARTLFPIGHYDKPRIREIAKEIGLEVHNKPDSQDICFIPDQDYERFLREKTNIKSDKGHFVDSEGNDLGEHKGIISYTIGQRKGLGVTFGKPKYVIDINGKDNTIVLGDNEDLFKNELEASNVNFIPFSIDEVKDKIVYDAKIRYSAKPARVTITNLGDDKINVVFDEPQRAITKGQSIVFYDGDILVGGGIIE